MAKAKRLAPKAPKHTVRLDLTEEEAMTLRSILMTVGGDPRGSRRVHVDTVIQALAHEVPLPRDYARERSGSIRFFTPDEMASRL